MIRILRSALEGVTRSFLLFRAFLSFLALADSIGRSFPSRCCSWMTCHCQLQTPPTSPSPVVMMLVDDDNDGDGGGGLLLLHLLNAPSSSSHHQGLLSPSSY